MLRYQPDFVTGARGIGRENPEAVSDREGVFALVFFAQLPLVAAYMPVEKVRWRLFGPFQGLHKAPGVATTWPSGNSGARGGTIFDTQ
jgi:hypothetical protein